MTQFAAQESPLRFLSFLEDAINDVITDNPFPASGPRENGTNCYFYLKWDIDGSKARVSAGPVLSSLAVEITNSGLSFTSVWEVSAIGIVINQLHQHSCIPGTGCTVCVDLDLCPCGQLIDLKVLVDLNGDLSVILNTSGAFAQVTFQPYLDSMPEITNDPPCKLSWFENFVLYLFPVRLS